MPSQPKIALATCRNLPDWEVDDLALHSALRSKNVLFECPIWDDPAVMWSQYDAVVIRTTWDYTDKHAEFCSIARHINQETRLFNPDDVIRWNTRKTYLRDLESRGVHIAPTVWIARNETIDLKRLMATLGWDSGFLKPQIGATARCTHRFTQDGVPAAQTFLDEALRHEDMMLQPYLPSVETQGEVSLIYFDGCLSHGVQKVPVPGDYRVQDDFGATDGAITPSDEMLSLGESTLDAALECLRLNEPLLYARVDLLKTEKNAWVLNELELVEPSLFFRHGPQAAEMLSDALLSRLDG